MKKDLPIFLTAFMLFVTAVCLLSWFSHAPAITAAGTIRLAASQAIAQLSPWFVCGLGIFIFIDGGLIIRKQIISKSAQRIEQRQKIE